MVGLKLVTEPEWTRVRPSLNQKSIIVTYYMYMYMNHNATCISDTYMYMYPKHTAARCISGIYGLYHVYIRICVCAYTCMYMYM